MEIVSIQPTSSKQRQPLQPFDHLCLPHYGHVSVVLGSPGLNTRLRMSLTGTEITGIIIQPPLPLQSCFRVQRLQLISPANNPQAVSVIKSPAEDSFSACRELNLAPSHLPRDHGAQHAEPSQGDWISEKVPERLLPAWAIFTVYFHRTISHHHNSHACGDVHILAHYLIRRGLSIPSFALKGSDSSFGADNTRAANKKNI